MEPKKLFLPIDAKDHERVIHQLAGIHRTAARLLVEGYRDGQADAWIYDHEGNFGALAFVYLEGYVVCYAAFDADPTDQAIISEIEDYLVSALNRKGERPLFFNVRGDNHALVDYLRSRGFNEDTHGYELVCREIAENPVDLCGLAMRGYEFQYFDAYVALLDGAFNPLIEQAGGIKDAFWREKEGLQERLAELSERGDFVAFWQGPYLVGIYYLSKDVIDVLAVHPDYQNRGYGGVILHHAVHRLLHQRHYPAAYLLVVFANQSALRLYLRQGFEVNGFYSELTYVGINC